MEIANDYMKEVLFAIAAIGLLGILYFVNKQIPGAMCWKGTRIQPRYSDRFPLVPTTDAERERKRPLLWLWNLAQLLIVMLVLIRFLKSLSK